MTSMTTLLILHLGGAHEKNEGRKSKVLAPVHGEKGQRGLWWRHCLRAHAASRSPPAAPRSVRWGMASPLLLPPRPSPQVTTCAHPGSHHISAGRLIVWKNSCCLGSLPLSQIPALPTAKTMVATGGYCSRHHLDARVRISMPGFTLALLPHTLGGRR